VDKYEYQVRVDQIKQLINEKRFAEAMEIADTIDWRRVRSVATLCMVSEIYKVNKRFEDSRDILLLAYERHPNGRDIIYALCELAIKMNDIVQAIECYKEFCQVAPDDPDSYILMYKIYKAQNVSLEEQIDVLEEYKHREYREKWAYELAYLYHLTGQESKCIAECDELILWFGQGKYVRKAMELKMLHVPLTEDQQAKYDGRVTSQIPVFNQPESDNQVFGNNPNMTGPMMNPYGEYVSMTGPITDQYGNIISNLDPYAGMVSMTGPMVDQFGNPINVPLQQYMEQPIHPTLSNSYGDTVQINEQQYNASQSRQGVTPANIHLGMTQDIIMHPTDDGRWATMDFQQELGNGVMQVMSDTRQAGPVVNTGTIDIKNAEIPPVKEEPLQIKSENEDKLKVSSVEKTATENAIINELQNNDTEPLSASVPKKSDVAEVPGTPKVPVKPSDAALSAAAAIKAIEESNSNTEVGANGSVVNGPLVKSKITGEIPEIVLPSEKDADKADDGVEELPEINQSEEDLKKADEEVTEKKAEEAPVTVEEKTEEPEKKEPDKEPEKEEVEVKEPEKKEEEGLSPEEIAAIFKDTSNLRARRELDDDEFRIFVRYDGIESMKAQLADTMDNMGMTGSHGNVIIMGADPNERKSLAIGIVKSMQNKNEAFSGKVAKITGEALNKKNIKSTFAKLQGGALIVEEAGGLNKETLSVITEVLGGKDQSIFVVLDDDKDKIIPLFQMNKEMKFAFDCIVDMGVFSNDDLVAYGRGYALEKEYTIDVVKDIIDEAIDHVDKKNMGHFMDMLLGHRYDEGDYIILREKDFNF